MADLVIVLGAGASLSAGVPLMAGFLDRARDLLDTGKVPNWADDFRLVFRALGLLSNVHSKARLDFVNLESVFNAFEMGRQLRKFPGLNEHEIERLVPAITTVIVRTVEKSMRFPMQGGAPIAPGDYAELMDTILWAQNDRRPALSTAIVTFNYDIGLDVALNRAGVPFTYSLDPTGQGLPLLKLHGSLNWLQVEAGIRILDVRRMLHGRDFIPGDEPTSIELPISVEHPEAPRDGAALPLIVPPTMSKGDYHRQVLPVWRRAAKELGAAQHVAICGYSMPPTDEFFKMLFGLGSEGPNPLRTLTVMDPEADVRERIGKLLGPGAEQRYRPMRGTFAEFPRWVRQLLN